MELGTLRPPNAMEAMQHISGIIAEGLSNGMQHISGVMQQLHQANRAGHARELQMVYALGRAGLELPEFDAVTDPYGAPVVADPEQAPPPSQQPSTDPAAPGLVLEHEDVEYGVEIGELHAQEELPPLQEEPPPQTVPPPQTEPPPQEVPGPQPRKTRLRKKTKDPKKKEDQKEDQ